jgi:hypothetical protein
LFRDDVLKHGHGTVGLTILPERLGVQTRQTQIVGLVDTRDRAKARQPRCMSSPTNWPGSDSSSRAVVRRQSMRLVERADRGVICPSCSSRNRCAAG